MSDLISRCELFNRLATIPAPAEANEFKAKIYEVIQEMETADRPQGEWFMGNRPLEGRFRIFRCSVCGYEPFYKGEPITPTNMTLRYCPNCGVSMKGATDGNK